MDLHQRQQFDLLLQTAVERFAERLEQRNGGSLPALARLRAEPEGEGVWLGEFTRAVFADFLLDNAAGACFVLQALVKRQAPPSRGGTIESVLLDMALVAFSNLLRLRTEEALEQRAGYQPVLTEEPR